jgi:hypothetical protein
VLRHGSGLPIMSGTTCNRSNENYAGTQLEGRAREALVNQLFDGLVLEYKINGTS